MIQVVLLSGTRGTGKTTACQHFVELAREAGLDVGGVLSLPRVEAGRKTGIEAFDLATGARRLLATRVQDVAQATVGEWQFDDEVMAWALEHLLAALQESCDVVVIDEIGPLELSAGRGFASALERLEAAQASVAILVVRAELLADLRSRLVHLRPQIIALTLKSRAQLPVRLLHAVWRIPAPPNES